MDHQNNSSAENNNYSQDNKDGATVKSCRCVLCGEEFVASSQQECMAHMEACQAFGRVHPTNGETNPDGVYPPAAAAAAVDNVSEDPTTKNIISQQQKQLEHAEENSTNPFN